ncbi:MAG: DNA mismatch repair protein MutS [Bacteroidia bacterium]|nr:DNA mismatch repair protein MutS [Bacteroidia bacterium]
MKQYNSVKAKYPDAIVLFRVGDFYETFSQDAVTTAQILGIVLTKRANGSASEVELAGFPHHALETYLPKLVRAGQRVAICDQLEDPKTTKTIVKRGVTELITPGIAINDQVLDHKSNNFLAVMHKSGSMFGVAFIDVSTGEYLIAEGDWQYMDKLLQNHNPSEVVFVKSYLKDFQEQYGTKFYTYTLDDWIFQYDFAKEKLLDHFGTQSLKGFGIADLQLGIVAAGAALHYASEMQHKELSQITNISRIDKEKYVWLDKFTIHNLELIYSNQEKAKTLYDILDRTCSPMGARLMKRWTVMPLKELELINKRLNIVEFLINNRDDAEIFQKQLKQVGDLERVISKVALRKINPREIIQLKKSLQAIHPIKNRAKLASSKALQEIANQLDACTALIGSIAKTLNDEVPVAVTKGDVVRDGINKDLDELREIASGGKNYLLDLQKREVEKTGISSLKLGFNNVFGYYIEVTHRHKDKVPSEWIRKQTLVNAERYITDELKEYEEKILGAEEKIHKLEQELFDNLVVDLSQYVSTVQKNAALVAHIDCLLAFSNIAISNNYVKPKLNTTEVIDIKEGRHPVLEQHLPLGEDYISNNIYLDNEQQQIIIVTGPNMSGKSALLRQTALIVLMAQMGSYVSAKAADIGLVDKVFTRVGASDNISSGESTFMVEMNETASILNNLSNRSLILLDEIGRGTSTYDGISIAWAIAHYLHEKPECKAKTLFATHYHELNEMANSYNRIKNYHVSIKESDTDILFLRKLVPGGSEHSFGIHVAKLAGMPNSVLQKAEKMLSILEQAHSSSELIKKDQLKKQEDQFQLSFFQLDDPLLEQIRNDLMQIDVNKLTPVEALMKLNEFKNLLRKS